MRHNVFRSNFRLIEAELYNYNETLAEIEEEKKDIIDTSPSELSSKSGPGKPTESKAVRMATSKAILEAERRTKAIADVLKMLEACNEPNKLKLLKLKYFENKYTDMGIQDELNIGRATFYRWRKEIIEMIAHRLGWRV